MKTKILFISLVSSLLLINFSSTAQNEKIQTAIIYQFTRLIEWCPSGKQGNFIIGVMCDEQQLLSEINHLQGRRVANQTIEIRHINKPDDALMVNIVMISRSRISQLSDVVSRIGTNCTLVIADQPGAAQQGATISFVENEGRLQFEINLEKARMQSLIVSNDLIRLAKNIY